MVSQQRDCVGLPARGRCVEARRRTLRPGHRRTARHASQAQATACNGQPSTERRPGAAPSRTARVAGTPHRPDGRGHDARLDTKLAPSLQTTARYDDKRVLGSGRWYGVRTTASLSRVSSPTSLRSPRRTAAPSTLTSYTRARSTSRPAFLREQQHIVVEGASGGHHPGHELHDDAHVDTDPQGRREPDHVYAVRRERTRAGVRTVGQVADAPLDMQSGGCGDRALAGEHRGSCRSRDSRSSRHVIDRRHRAPVCTEAQAAAGKASVEVTG